MRTLRKLTASPALSFVILGIFVLFSFIASASIGSVTVPFGNTLKVILSALTGTASAVPATDHSIVSKIRLPRVMLGMLVGASLSLSGLVFQALLRNPLADPYTLGVSAGASFGAGLSIFLSYLAGEYFRSLMPVFAFSGGIATIYLVYFLARLKGRVQVLTIILSGVVVSYLFSAGLVLVMSLLGERTHEILFWLMGSLAGYHRSLLLTSILILAFILVVCFFYRELDLMSLGDEQAKNLGVNTEFVRLFLLSTASLLTALSVSLTGTIGFLGLIVPHSMRLLLGPQHGRLMPASVLAGAGFLPLSDMLARTLPGLLFQAGVEIPVGVVTALCGSPFFVVLLVQGKRRSWF